MNANATFADVMVTPGAGIAFQDRPSTGGGCSNLAISGAAPAWVKLARSGSVFNAYYSSDGATWNSIGSAAVSMAANVYIGLAVTAHNNTLLNTSTFDNVSLTTATPPVVAINAGGTVAGSFAADANYNTGSTYTTTTAVSTAGVTNPAPQAVYQSERYGNFTYTFGNLTSGAAYTVRLHFAEIWWTAAGVRVFNVALNGQAVLSNFDIYAAAGGNYKAIVKEFSATAVNGQITISFTTVKDNAKVSGIEILSATGRALSSSAPRADENGVDAGISAIDLGTVTLHKPFKLKLDAPTSHGRLRWSVLNSPELPGGVRVKSRYIVGKPKAAGTFTFRIEIAGKAASAANTYTLTVQP